MEKTPQRKKARLAGYDYGQNGAYFITVCTKDRQHLLGKVVVGSDALGAPCTQLSRRGMCVYGEIVETPQHYAGVPINHFVVMPNHIHPLIMVGRDNGAPRASRPTTALIPTIAAAFRKETNRSAGLPVWQKTYHDHILRSESDYQTHWQYIDENPAKWAEDEYYNG